ALGHLLAEGLRDAMPTTRAPAPRPMALIAPSSVASAVTSVMTRTTIRRPFGDGGRRRRITPRMDFERLRASTLPGLLVERARTRPDRVAFRAKELGVYRETSWAHFAERVAAVALGFFHGFGVTRGDAVAIMGNPCPEWTIADLAAQALGALTYGIYPTSAPGEVRYLLQ